MSEMPSILHVEDEEAVSFILGKEFEAKGYRVIKAANGKEGLDAALREHPDVIITDLKMPVMNGTEMIHELRNDEWGKDAKIIVLTNFSDMDVLQEVLAQGALCIVKGDMKMEEIVGRVKDLLENKQTTNPLR